jgi:hypothetical protein
LRVCANPSFVIDGCALTPEIRQRDKIPGLAFLTFGEIILFHEIHLPTGINLLPVYNESECFSRLKSTDSLKKGR